MSAFESLGQGITFLVFCPLSNGTSGQDVTVPAQAAAKITQGLALD